MNMVSVVCVLKKGGVFTEAHVAKLREGIKRNLNIPHQFACLSDIDFPGSKPLLNNYPKWWSKIEAFRITGAVIYFDLDTAIFGCLDSLAGSILKARQSNTDCFYMLRTFQKTERWTSTVMAWSGNWRCLYDEFTAGNDMYTYGYDQRYIIAKMQEKNKPIIAVQSLVKGTVWCSKHHVPTDEEIERRNVTISCFYNKIIK